LEALDQHADGDGPPVVVTGEAGSGKSALLAAWVERRRRQLPDEILLAHLVGTGSCGFDKRALVRRILAELNARLGLGLDYPADPAALRACLADALRRVAALGPLVLVLDGVDQLEAGTGGDPVEWLPDTLPAGVRLVVSAGPGPALDKLSERGWPTVAVGPLTPEERAAVIEAYLAMSAKALAPARVAALAAAPAAANPRYLRTVLEELRQFGARARLDERIAWYLEAGDEAGLFERVLSRWEQDFEGDRPGLVGDVAPLLCLARRGLGEEDLRHLLGKEGEPLPQAVWSPLRLAAGEFLATSDGLISVAQPELRRAVERRYLADEERRQAVHLRLADYFEARAGGERRDEELPWQLARAGEWGRLARLLADPDTLASLWQRDESETLAYWAQVEANSESRMVAAYRPLLDAPEAGGWHVWQVA